MRDRALEFSVARLGECRHHSPMTGVRFTRDDERVIYHRDRADETLARRRRSASEPRRRAFKNR